MPTGPENERPLALDLTLVEELEAELDELEAALHRLDEGTYGEREDCGGEVPAEHLEAHPGARLCDEDRMRR